MHSKDYDHDITIFHNGDYSGRVIISLPQNFIQVVDGTIYGRYAVELPFDILKQFVAEYVRSKAIEELEQADAEDLLLG